MPASVSAQSSDAAEASTLLDLSPEEHAQRQAQETGLTPVGYQLNALDPTSLADFYMDLMGMSLIDSNEDDGYYALGTPDGDILLELFQATSPRRESTTGLYHGAFLYDSEVEFGTVLAHLLENRAPMQGYSHHNYSQAAYLGDTEGNNIEIYLDTAPTIWRVDENGYKNGGSEPLDITKFLLQRESEFNGMSDGVKMGHFHLSVNNITDTEWFYGEVLGLGQTAAPATDTAFFATGDYHHYLGTNIWVSEGALAPTEEQQGLRATIWQAASPEDVAYITEQLDSYELAYEETDDALTMHDNSGLKVIVLK
ncbi:VOC family protein [Fundicoccus ignavus]|nr:VOC family protein [Fundicoccus ignavus]